MTFRTVLKDFNSNLWGHHIVVPDHVAQKFIDGTDRRVVCCLDERLEFQCALIPKGDGTWFININKAIREKLGIREGSELEAELRKDTSKYGMPISEEMAELLGQDPEADEIFHSLTPGKQRSLLHMVNTLKRTDSRLRKAVVIVEYLKVCQGNLNYRELSEAFKRANRN